MSGRVAEQLGAGASFGATRGGVSARRQAVAAATGVPTAGAPDSRLRTLPLEQLVPTRFNPRRNFGTKDDLREFGLKLKKKQLQPAVAVTRDAYLALWKNEADNIGSAEYVIANGERRYRASLAAGLTTLEVVVDDDVAKSRADFLDAVLSENNDREDLDPIERALGIETMVQEIGGVHEVATHYGKSAPWVSQQRRMLKLVPELQTLVSSGEMPQREGYRIAGLPAGEQAAKWQAELQRRKEEDERRKAARDIPSPRKKKPKAAPPATSTPETAPVNPSGFSALNDGESPGSAAGTSDSQPSGSDTEQGQGFSALNSGSADEGQGASELGEHEHDAPPSETADDSQDASPESPDPSTNAETNGTGEAVSDGVLVKWLPLDNPHVVLRILRARMKPAAFEELVKEAVQVLETS